MPLGQPQPLIFSLEKTEITSRSTSPLVVLWHTYSKFRKNPLNIGLRNAVFFEGKYRPNVGFRTLVAVTVFVRTNAHIRNYRIITNPLLKRPDLEFSCTPASIWRRQEVVIHIAKKV